MLEQFTSADRVAMNELLSAADRIGLNPEQALAGMVLAIAYVGAGMQDEQRWQVARAVYATADELAAPNREQAK